jgi:hypothetical protein
MVQEGALTALASVADSSQVLYITIILYIVITLFLSLVLNKLKISC